MVNEYELNQLTQKVKAFLKEYDFVALEWDGYEITAFSLELAEDGVCEFPHGPMSFSFESPTRLAFDTIQEEIEDLFDEETYIWRIE